MTVVITGRDGLPVPPHLQPERLPDQLEPPATLSLEPPASVPTANEVGALSQRGTWGDRVTINISAWRCPDGLLRRSVESILGQTYQNIALVVVADGEPDVLREIDDIDDERLTTVAVSSNHGQFFVHDAVARATPDPFFAVQDADDWSEPNRIERQLQLLLEGGADLSITSIRFVGGRRYGHPNLKARASFNVPHFGCHMGIYRTDSLLSVGGYNWGQRLCTDTLVVALVQLHGHVVASRDVLYHYNHRPQSMTTSPDTGLRSSRRDGVRNLHNLLYMTARRHETADETRSMAESRLPDDMKRERDTLACHLRPALESSTTPYCIHISGRGHQVVVADTYAKLSSMTRGASRNMPLSTRGTWGDRVTVNIPVWKCDPELVRRSVNSILYQTYSNVAVVVVADGEAGDLDAIDDIDDPRVIRLSIPHNRSQFFIHDLVARATPDPFFAVQDADDWSEPNRIERQLEILLDDRADLALTTVQYSGSRSGVRRPNLQAHGYLPHIGCHTGIYRTDSLLAVGGYYWGERIGVDTLVMALVHLHGRVATCDEILYHYDKRSDSMTMAKKTGFGSARRLAASQALAGLYREARAHTDPEQTLNMLQRRLAPAMLAERSALVQTLRAQFATEKEISK